MPKGNHRNDVELIYHRYLQAFKKGVYNYIKEEQDPLTQEMVPRKYFSGGFNLTMTTDAAMKIEDASNNPAMLRRLINIAGTALIVIGAVLTSPAHGRAYDQNGQFTQSQGAAGVQTKTVEGVVNQLYDVDPNVAKKAADQLRTMDSKTVLQFLVDYMKDGRVFQKYHEMLDLKREAMIRGVEEKIENGQQRALWQEFLNRYLISGQDLQTAQFNHGLYGWLKGQKDSADAQHLYQIIQDQENRWLNFSFYTELGVIHDMDNEEAKTALEDLVHDNDIPAEYKNRIIYFQNQHPDMMPKYLLYAALTIIGIVGGLGGGMMIAERRYKTPLLSSIVINNKLKIIKSKVDHDQSVEEDVYDL